jgi:hypothetical protein
MSLTQTLQGRASAWLLARPSQHAINRASLITAFGVCLVLLAAIIALSLAQWILSERLQLARIEREQHLARLADTSLSMAMAASNAHRATLSGLLARDESELSDSLHRRQTALDEYDTALDSIEDKLSPATLEQKQTTAALAKNYRALSAQLLDLIQKCELPRALDFRLEHLRPAFEQWQSAHDKFAHSKTRDILQKDAAQLQTIQNLRLILLSLVIAPAGLLFIGTLAIFAILGFGYLTRKNTPPADAWSH